MLIKKMIEYTIVAERLAARLHVNLMEYTQPLDQTDYEAATISAHRFVFPNMSIKGCFFHYSQALWRKCQALGLDTGYLHNTTIHQVVRLAILQRRTCSRGTGIMPCAVC
ncbi:unnamed protein product [Gordionus sp. m RMFG-2023]